MIYNLHRYFEIEFPALTIFCNVKDFVFPDTDIPDSYVEISELNGTDGAWYRYNQQRIYFLIKDIDMVKCRETAQELYEKLHGKFGLLLPAVTVSGTTYSALETAQISSVNTPQSEGYDDRGRAVFSFTMNIIYMKG